MNGDMAANTGVEGGLRDRLAYLLVLSRPRFWLYLAGPVIVGAAAAASTLADLLALDTVLLFAYFLIPANVFLYGVNDVFDADIDEANPKKDDREARWRGDPVNLVVVVGSGVLGVGLFALTPQVAWPWLVAYFFLAVEYSAPPFRFKTTPFLDSVSNGLYILPGVAAYAAITGSNPPTLAIAGAWLWTMGMHTFSAIPDIDPDRETGIQTTATVLGERRTYAYCAVVWGLAAAAFAAVDVRLGGLLAAYPVVVLGIALSGVDVERAYWWYPILNTVVGMLITVGALWGVVYG
ncbi:prenyltransferase [Haloferax mediterranei ATCC 33500]|uniref:Prenyltransferase n=1 Tax=Haloferax mediterranei (strain ATCC 33500 / DSM 1411 / JCM 8866 / NBRC 14739 / NCIMB 2177 / R-4) TaxID=523841 RepID=I3R7M0_HALMT|nr:prenyltransferase [Haloferax mediterranei]AFK20230.1 prenyltransferase (4-hydroxybenzoate octaprenyltransferase, protoheme IX farnesyltransferase) [Haloferax mediterranei ATCC 33500]AHZ23601.1 prenyltransferase [Haloferax mediterranei ATCC 33500]ELZ99085.1 prenyltransferase [Haloferax mediterranei ATCC 33500]MDX5987018.1 prenyltransferase [Haloferax mediterranei ATCC 33500]QCQ76335.1 prenyltransferase [Haloferax mediterranei ATCC 33500]